MLSFCITYSPLFCALYTHVHFLVPAIRNSRVVYAEIVVLFGIIESVFSFVICFLLNIY